MKEILEYIRSDYQRYSGRRAGLGEIVFQALWAKNTSFAYSFWMRLASRQNPFYLMAKFMHRRLSHKYGVMINARTKIGYGFYIGHAVGIIINEDTIIGNNCNISQFLSIGTNHDKPAVIGDNVYIGPNVCIVENVHIGNYSLIGAGAVVLKDVPANSTAVGCPAKVIGENKHREYIGNCYDVLQTPSRK